MIIELSLRPGESERELIARCSKKLRAPCGYFKILKKSLDARDKRDIRWVYSVECAVHPPKREQPVFFQAEGEPKVVIAGMGPAGLFCALRLLRHGIRPLILERGRPVGERTEAVGRFFQTGVLDTESNVQFGEGGAGTFSDGKLVTRTKSPFNRAVLDGFVRFGAPEEVGYLGKPHIGTDILKKVVQNIRNYLLAEGCELRYSARLDDLFLRDGRLVAVSVNGEKREADELVLAVGHSARDTFGMLLSRGFLIEPKGFAVGVRIEHLQEKIGRAQYGELFASLPAADYQLVSHASERAAFTFCMCPGGAVIPAASEEGGVVTNGMSDFVRDGRNADSALVVQVGQEDFGSEHPLAGIRFQRELERAAYRAGGGGYRAPVQRLEDFLAGRESKAYGEVLPTYARGVSFADLHAVLPQAVSETMKSAVPDMDRRLHGFADPDALMTGVESRTSSPVRIVRGEDLQAVGKAGVYPCGEGCGYAGGITSAAADGIRVAEAIAKKYEKHG